MVEDDDLIRAALEEGLDSEGYTVKAVPDGRTVEQVAEQFRPDLAILDVNLGMGPDGYTIARRLRGASTLPILFLTGADTVEDRLAGFNVGADDYMAKPFSMAELQARARALLRRAGRLSSAVRQVGDLVLDEGARTVIRGGTLIDLTPSEYELMRTLVEHPGQVLSRSQLLARLWGYDLGDDTNVVNVHMSSLRRKLEAHGPRLIHTVRGMGYVLRA